MVPRLRSGLGLFFRLAAMLRTLKPGSSILRDGFDVEHVRPEHGRLGAVLFDPAADLSVKLYQGIKDWFVFHADEDRRRRIHFPWRLRHNTSKLRCVFSHFV